VLKLVVREWLQRVTNERDIDAALVAYLGAVGYRDVHFTHGTAELGKDFIAKSADRSEQLVLQAKKGDIATSEWRALRDQLWEAMRIGLSHPMFDRALPRRGILVLTGELAGGAKEQLARFNDELVADGKLPIEVWHREELIRRFCDTDPVIVYPANRQGFYGYGQFFSLYGAALDRRADARTLEQHSRNWLAEVYGPGHLLLPAVEASVLADAAEVAHDHYLAFQARLTLVRVALDAEFATAANDDVAFFSTASEVALEGAIVAAQRFVDDVWGKRATARDKKLLNTVPYGTIIAYPVLCLRLSEALAFLYLTSTDTAARAEALARLRKIIVTEDGVHHPLSDRYAVSIVVIARALFAGEMPEIAKAFLRSAAFWILNAYVTRKGLAPFEADENGEVDQLFGPSFPELDSTTRTASFAVTALLDVCAFFASNDLYETIENDIRANRIFPEYQRTLDTRGQFRIDGVDIVRSPNVQFVPNLSGVARFAHGEHLIDEPRTFAMQGRYGGAAHLALSLLLRDRYFPTTWETSL